MFPIANVSPGACVVVSVAAPELSVAVGAVQLAAAPEADVASSLIFPGQLAITGAVVSETLNVTVAAVAARWFVPATCVALTEHSPEPTRVTVAPVFVQTVFGPTEKLTAPSEGDIDVKANGSEPRT